MVYLAIDSKLAGTIAISDPIKDSAISAIAALKSAGLNIVMLTGDNEHTARAVAEQLAALLGGQPLDVVLSDLAPNLSGVAVSDAARMSDLVEIAAQSAATSGT